MWTRTGVCSSVSSLRREVALHSYHSSLFFYVCHQRVVCSLVSVPAVGSTGMHAIRCQRVIGSGLDLGVWVNGHVCLGDRCVDTCVGAYVGVDMCVCVVC